jgi:hypothetical protein
MYRIDDATAATLLPAPEAAGTEGYFTEGNPTAGTPAHECARLMAEYDSGRAVLDP